jgi:hypothetical protein
LDDVILFLLLSAALRGGNCSRWVHGVLIIFIIIFIILHITISGGKRSGSIGNRGCGDGGNATDKSPIIDRRFSTGCRALPAGGSGWLFPLFLW